MRGGDKCGNGDDKCSDGNGSFCNEFDHPSFSEAIEKQEPISVADERNRESQ